MEPAEEDRPARSGSGAARAEARKAAGATGATLETPLSRRGPDGTPPRRGLDSRRKLLFLRVAVWCLGSLPLALLGLRLLDRGLGANPIETVIHHFGFWGLALLLVTLAVTPLRRLTGENTLVKVRRPLGLFAFFYLTLHMLSYVGLDQFFAWSYIVEDVVERPFISVGFLAYLLLLPLALTSTRGWIRRLGRNWTRLHRLVYVAAGLGVLHFYWRVKADEPDPLVLGAVLAVLLAARLPMFARRRRLRG